MPPIDGPITATTWSMPSFSFISRYCDSTMSRMVNFGNCMRGCDLELLGEVVKNSRGNHLRLRFLMPRDEQPQGGLTIYGCNAGRYPLGPTLIID